MTDEPPEPEWLDDHCLSVHEGRVEIADPEEPHAFIEVDADDMVHLGSMT
jgi:hypothetical protein